MVERGDAIPPIAREKYQEENIPGVEGMTISFEIPGYALLHYSPPEISGEDKRASITRRAKIWNEGLLGAAVMVAHRQDIEKVGVVSWIVKKNPKILEREGFREVSPGEFYTLGQTYISRIEDSLVPEPFADQPFDVKTCNKKDFVQFQYEKNGVLQD